MIRFVVGDCRDVMASMDPASVDAIVTDPPYGLSFMGKGWDHGVPGVEFWTEALRVLKPGGHLLAFGGTRTHHRLMVAIEDAGFEIRDCLMWLYGSGFPKSLDVSKAIDKAAGADRPVVRMRTDGNKGGGAKTYDDDAYIWDKPFPATEPATDAAKQWDGWGTALKPAWEPIILARKPLSGTVAANVQAHGTGALNIDGCRIESGTRPHIERQQSDTSGMRGIGDAGFRSDYQQPMYNTAGRWPANVALDEDAAALLDAQSGISKSTGGYRGSGSHGSDGWGMMADPEKTPLGFGDTGGASRFFYVAKASRAERNAGLDGMPERALNWSSGEQSPGTFQAPNTNRNAANYHPTVKPVALMRWLVRMVTPPGGVVLDPFGGSGSTMVAVDAEGFDGIYIDIDDGYADIARRRVTGTAPLFARVESGNTATTDDGGNNGNT